MVDMNTFMKKWDEFWENRICGETLVFNDMERFMSRTSSKNLKLLMKGKKMEGYMEGSLDKLLTPKQKIAIGTVITLVMVGVIALVILKNEGLI